MKRLRLCFSELGVDALLVSHLPNIQYLCGFSGSAAFLLIDSSESTLFTDSRYTFQAREEVVGAHVNIARKGLLAAVSEALKAPRGRTHVAYSAGKLTVAQMDLLRGASGSRVRWRNDGNVVEKLRTVKDPRELSIMQDAATLVSKAFSEVLSKIRPGHSELEVAAEIDYRMKRLGASNASFDTIVASGLRSAWAHARPTSKKLRARELVVLDHGAILGGYCSDMTRTVFLGRAPQKVRRAYGAVLEAQQVAKNFIRPGRKAEAIDLEARRVLKQHGLAQYFTHSTGHGLGLEVHEMPRLAKGESTILQEGMVITVEPGVYLDGCWGIRIEDDVVVTATGSVDLTSAPRELLEL
jgi:Xaa-Pro aminopeptidase